VKTRINTLCYMSMLLLGTYISVYQSIINSISKSYSINNTSVGIIISLHFIGSLIAPVIFGEISDRIGKKSVVIISYIILIAGLLSIYLFDNLLLIAAGIFIIGCGFAVIEGTLSGVLSDVNTVKTSKVISISQMFFSIGAVAGPLVALLLINLSGSWKAVFLLVIVLFGLILVYFIRLQFGESVQIVRSDTGLISTKLFKEKIFIFLFISMFIFVGIEEGVAFWLITYFGNLYNASQLGAYTLSGYWASMIIGRYLASRFYSKQSLFLKGGLLTSLLFIIAALVFRNSMVNFVCFIGVGIGLSAVWPIIMSITADNYPRYTGTALGIMMTAGAGGGIAIPFIIGILANSIMIDVAFWVIPVLIVMISILQMQVPKIKEPFQNEI
jgi:fucose permease